jgi:hypothetical protein
MHLDRARGGEYLPWFGAAVTNYQPTSRVITLVDELVHVGGDFSFQSSRQHPPRTLPNDLVDQRWRRQRCRILSRRTIPRDYRQHGRAFPTSASGAGLA